MPSNSLVDVEGLRVGHHERIEAGWLTGTTVVLAAPGTVGGVSVGGGGASTSELTPLDPTGLVPTVDAICLSGGSAYGLAAADGVRAWLAGRHQGYRVGPERHHVVPIVPAAVVFDLGAGGAFTNRPTAAFGRRAAAAASNAPVPLGSVGAGAASRAHSGLLRSASVATTASVVLSGRGARGSAR